MAITDTKKIDYLWKKLGYGVTKTDDANRKSASNESIPSPLIIRGDRIWLQSDQIPAVLPDTSSEIVQVYNDYLSNTVECIMDVTSTPLRTWKTSLTDWVPIEFGSTYQVKVYVDDPNAYDPQTTGERLYPDGTGNDEWFFDYASGVLHFIGDTLPSPLVTGKSIYITGARYVGLTGVSNLDLDGSSTPAVSGVLPASEAFVADGIAIKYTLSYTPASSDAIDVYVNDVLQRPGEVFSLNANLITFNIIPPAGTDIYVKYRYPFATIIDNPNNSIENRHLKLVYTSDQYNGDGGQRTFDVNPGHTVHDILVIVDGLILPPQAYSVLGTVLTLDQPPSEDSIVDIRYLPV
jgi:hypothetical protein